MLCIEEALRRKITWLIKNKINKDGIILRNVQTGVSTQDISSLAMMFVVTDNSEKGLFSSVVDTIFLIYICIHMYILMFTINNYLTV